MNTIILLMIKKRAFRGKEAKTPEGPIAITKEEGA
jgi:hypothetical protein